MREIDCVSYIFTSFLCICATQQKLLVLALSPGEVHTRMLNYDFANKTHWYLEVF